MVSLSKRLYGNVKRNGKCLEWAGNKDKNGYGRMSVHNKSTLTHRIAWELSNGPIPKGLCVLHKCDNPSCIRIDHLFLGDRIDNNHDCIRKGRANKRGLIGEEHNLAKLTDADVMAIRASDERGKDLAERYDVEQTTITDVRKGKTWQHLPVDGKHLANKNHKITEADVIAIRASGKTPAALAEEYGISTRSISALLYGETYPHLSGIRKSKGKGNFTGKLTESDVLNIRSSNESSKILAALYNVDKSSIANIKSRRTWNHIGG